MEINPIMSETTCGRSRWAAWNAPSADGGDEHHGIRIEGAKKPEFESLAAQQIDKLNTEMLAADKAVSDLASGKSENIHGALIEMQKANLSFKMLVEVRNKALSAYEELMRMQA